MGVATVGIRLDGRWMMCCRLIMLVSLSVIFLQGCGSDNSEQIVALQKQISLLSRQIEEARKDIGILRETDNNLKQSLDVAEAELNRLKALEVLPPSAVKEKAEEVIIPTASDRMPAPRSSPAASGQRSAQLPAGQTKPTSASCVQVWALLGQGKTETATAQALHITLERVRACEQQVGRGKAQ